MFGAPNPSNTPSGNPPGTSTTPGAQASIFGSGAFASGSLFGKTEAPASASGGLFGKSEAPASSSGGLFGKTEAVASSSGGLFGKTETPASTSGGLFGKTEAPASTAGTLFGKTEAPAPALSSGSLFGKTETPASSSGTLFGKTEVPASSSGTLFSKTEAPASTSGTLFGKSEAPASTSGGLFGKTEVPAPALSSGSLFGKTEVSIFDQKASTDSTASISAKPQGPPLLPSRPTVDDIRKSSPELTLALSSVWTSLDENQHKLSDISKSISDLRIASDRCRQSLHRTRDAARQVRQFQTEIRDRVQSSMIGLKKTNDTSKCLCELFDSVTNQGGPTFSGPESLHRHAGSYSHAHLLEMQPPFSCRLMWLDGLWAREQAVRNKLESLSRSVTSIEDDSIIDLLRTRQESLGPTSESAVDSSGNLRMAQIQALEELVKRQTREIQQQEMESKKYHQLIKRFEKHISSSSSM